MSKYEVTQILERNKHEHYVTLTKGERTRIVQLVYYHGELTFGFMSERFFSELESIEPALRSVSDEHLQFNALTICDAINKIEPQYSQQLAPTT